LVAAGPRYDTSVFGGCFDAEFVEHSTRFFRAVQDGRIVVLVSDTVAAELAGAPEHVRRMLLSIPSTQVERVDVTPAVLALRDAYLTAGIVGPTSRNDATHVVAATVARADAIVSWNFKHIVHLGRIRRYNEVNIIQRYGMLIIMSPAEVRFDDDETQ
jgi:hypothetical protein